MKLSGTVLNSFYVRALCFLTGAVLSLPLPASPLHSQEPLRAQKTESEPTSGQETAPLKEESPGELEDVAATSATIPKSWFQNVQVTPVGIGIQVDEVPAYFKILDHVRGVPPENLSKADREFRLKMIEEFGNRTRARLQREVTDETQQKRVLEQLDERLKQYRDDPFSYELVRDAFNQAATCQGHVVSFSGHVRRSRSLPAGENDYGFDQLYEVWLFDEEANHYPVIVVCTALPENFPVNLPDTETVDGVSVRGYFFKLYAYEGGEKYHAIPMILARTVTWNPPKTVSRRFPRWAYAIVVVLGVVVLGLIVWTSRPGRNSQSVRDKLNEPDDNPFQPPN